MSYSEKLKSPEWQKKRLEIFQRDKFTCQICLDTKTTLNVHHKKYIRGRDVWDYPDSNFMTLCEVCHAELSKHIKKYGTSDEFDLCKLKRDHDTVMFMYNRGDVSIKRKGKDWVLISESVVKDLVHFIINNWLKNG